MEQNDFVSFFKKDNERYMMKYDNYLEIYNSYFKDYKNKEVNFLEIGIADGGSINMWKYYFGEKLNLFAVDVNEKCREFEEEKVKVFIGSQSDRNFLRTIKNQSPQFDIILDDGGHRMNQQIVTFEEMFDHVKDGGIYMCEDVHTSYYASYGGGKGRNGTFIEYCKNLIDQIHAFHSEQRSFKVDKYSLNIESIHFYDSIVVIKKSKRQKHKPVETGTQKKATIIPDEKLSLYKKKVFVLDTFEKILRFFNIKSPR